MEKEIKEETSDGLVVVQKVDIPALFKKDGCDPLVKRIKEEVAKFKPNISTVAGRKEIASLAHKVARSKIYIDTLGKDLGDDYKQQLNIINGERKKLREELDGLKDEVRKPLTEWEDTEKQRVRDLGDRVAAIEASVYAYSHDHNLDFDDAAHVEKVLNEIKAIEIDDSFGELANAAAKVKDQAVTQLEAKVIVLKSREKEQAEAERLEKERLEKEQKEHEEKIASEAAEKATKEAEEKSRKEAEEKAVEEKAGREKLEREKLESDLAKEKAEKEKLEAEELAKKEKIEAEEKAEKEKLEAVEAEKKRQKEEELKEEAADKKRQENKRHRTKINNEAKKGFISKGYSPSDAEKIVTMIAQGLIPNITINY